MTTKQTYKIARAAGFRSMDRDLAADFVRALERWMRRNSSRCYREIGVTSSFLLVELTLEESDAAPAADDLMVICEETQLTLSQAW